MAENETLDLNHKNSGRWRALQKTLRRCPDVFEVVDELYRALVVTAKRVQDRIPIGEILHAAQERDTASIDEIIRCRCKDARDYAELLRQAACGQRDPEVILKRFFWSSIRAVVRRIEIRLDWPAAAHFRLLKPAMDASLRPRVAALSRSVASQPHRKPRLPARSCDEKQQAHQKLLSLSLRHKEG